MVLLSGRVSFCGAGGCKQLTRRCDCVVAKPGGAVSDPRRSRRFENARQSAVAAVSLRHPTTFRRIRECRGRRLRPLICRSSKGSRPAARRPAERPAPPAPPDPPAPPAPAPQQRLHHRPRLLRRCLLHQQRPHRKPNLQNLRRRKNRTSRTSPASRTRITAGTTGDTRTRKGVEMTRTAMTRGPRSGDRK